MVLLINKKSYTIENFEDCFKELNIQLQKRLFVFSTIKINIYEASYTANQTQGQER